MTVQHDFQAAVAASTTSFPGPELLPQRLARACASVLPVDGAGISLFFSADRRLPLGASDDRCAEAERLQFTVGEGPCLTAHAEGRSLSADADELAARWPVYFAELAARTPIRGIVSVPLEDPLDDFGALDLYLVPPNGVAAVPLADAVAVAKEVAGAFLSAVAPASTLSEGPAWLDAPAAGRRSLVWQAMGVLDMALGVTSTDALALLRAHAYGEGEDIDTSARALVEGRLAADQLS